MVEKDFKLICYQEKNHSLVYGHLGCFLDGYCE